MKETMRKLFTDHAVYTKFYINSFLDGADNGFLDATAARLLANQKDIGDAVKPIVGSAHGAHLTKLLQAHIMAAVAVLKELRAGAGHKERLKKAIEALFANSEQVGAFLHTLHPTKLPLTTVKREFKRHNQHVIDMAVLHAKKQFKKEQRHYDMYYNHMLRFSDLLYAALK